MSKFALKRNYTRHLLAKFINNY